MTDEKIFLLIFVLFFGAIMGGAMYRQAVTETCLFAAVDRGMPVKTAIEFCE